MAQNFIKKRFFIILFFIIVQANMSSSVAVAIKPNDFTSIKSLFGASVKQAYKITFSSQSIAGVDIRGRNIFAVHLSDVSQPFCISEGNGITFSAERSFLNILEHSKLWTTPKSNMRPLEGFSLQIESLKIILLGDPSGGGLLFVCGNDPESFFENSFPGWRSSVIGSWVEDDPDMRLAQSSLVIRRTIDSDLEEFDANVAKWRGEFIS